MLLQQCPSCIIVTGFLKVVMFEEPLGNRESQLVVTYLSEKYRIRTSDALGTIRDIADKKAPQAGTIVDKPVITGLLLC